MPREQEDEVMYYPEQMEEVRPIPSLNLPDIEEIDCLRPTDGARYQVFFCKGIKKSNRVCPYCASINVYSHGKLPKDRLVHDVNVGLTKVDILLEVDRYKCQDCGGTFARSFDGIMEQRQMTTRLYEQLQVESFRTPFVDLSSISGYSETTIADIFDEYAEWLEANRGPIIAPRVLGIDEKHIVNEMRAIFVDIETGQILEMTEKNKRKDIIDTIENMVDYDKNIEIVTMDMANGYRSYVQEILPYAKIVVDKYHVLQDLGAKVTRTKTYIMDALKKRIDSEPDEQLKKHLNDVKSLASGDTYLFKYNHKKLAEKPNRLAAMADVCKTFPELNHLRLLKEGFECIYDCNNIDDAEALYNRWEPLVPPVGVHKIAAWEKKYGVEAELFKEFRSFKNAMTSWHEEVFNYFRPGLSVTNAASEGTNCLIQRINQSGNGYSFKRLRAKILYWHTAGQRIHYSFINKKKHAPNSNTDNNGGRWMGFATYGFIRLETVCELEQTVEKREYHPVSVLDYYRLYGEKDD